MQHRSYRFSFISISLLSNRRLYKFPNRPAALILGGVAALAFGLHLVQARTGPFEGIRLASDYGQAGFSTSSSEYPRVATDAGGYAVRVARPAHRIASHYWSVDEYVYSVAPAGDVVSVSSSAYERSMSNVYERAEKFQPVVAENPEDIIRLDPDLVIDGGEGSADFSDILRNAGLPVFRVFTMFTTLDQVGRTILLTGYLTGHDTEANRAYREFQDAIQRAEDRKPSGSSSPRVLGFGGRYSYGDQTLFHDIVRAVGAVNVSAEHGLHGYDAISTEQVLRWNPEWIIAGSAKGKSAETLQRFLDDPAIQLTTAAQKGQILVFENHVFLPMSPFTVLLLDAMSEALYPVRPKEGM
jgi:iron complex transport system substrate-binding protein